MDRKLRRYFDEQLQRVIDELPANVRRFLDEVPVYVEDFPSAKLCREMNVEYRDGLCGLYVGKSTLERSVLDSGELSEVVYLFREGIISESLNDAGELDEAELRRQIRITLLHEIGHNLGLDEDDLTELGYG